MAKPQEQTAEGRALADAVFAVAVERGDWLPEQRAAFDTVQARHFRWWYTGRYHTEPGWQDQPPWKEE